MAKKKSKKQTRARQDKKRARVKNKAPTAKTTLAKTRKIPKPKIAKNRRKATKAAIKKPRSTTKKIKNVIRKPRLIKPGKHKTRSLKKAVKFLSSFFKPTAQKKLARSASNRKKKLAKKYPTRFKEKAKTRAPAPKVVPETSIRKLKSGQIKTIKFPVKYENLEQWLNDLEKNPTLDGLIPANASLGFRFFDNNSLKLFTSIKDALVRIGAYNTTLTAIESGNAKEQSEVYRHIEFVTVESDAVWETSRTHFEREIFGKPDATGRNSGNRSSRGSMYRDTYWRRLKERNPGEYARQLARKRAKANARYRVKKGK